MLNEQVIYMMMVSLREDISGVSVIIIRKIVRA